MKGTLMKTSTTSTLALFAAIGILLTTALEPTPACAADAPASWVPADAIFFLTVPSVNQLRDNFKKTSSFGLYKDPDMQAFIQPAEKQLRAKIDKMLTELWKETHVQQPPDKLPMPQGQLVFIAFAQLRTVMQPDYENIPQDAYQEDGDIDWEKIPEKEVEVPDFQIVALADMGDQLEKAKELTEQLRRGALESGAVPDRTDIRSVQINSFKTDPEQDVDFDVLSFGFKDRYLVVGSSLKYIKAVLINMDQPAGATLADDPAFRQAHRRVGTGQLFAYLNVPALIAVQQLAAPSKHRQQASRTIDALGLNALRGVALGLDLAPDQQHEARLQVFAPIQGQPKGLLAIFTPLLGDTQPGPLLTNGLAQFTVANYDLAKVYAHIVKLAYNISNVNLDMMLESAMEGMAGPNGDAMPPVNVRQDIIEQLRSPIIVTKSAQKPYTDPRNSRSLLAIAVRDASTLNNAIGSIHTATIAKAKPDMQREILNTTLYLLPPMPLPFMMNPLQDSGQAPPSQLAFAVAADQFLFGRVETVEQAIRDLQREQIESIKTDPVYQHAGRSLPDQAGLYYYSNGQIEGEILWATLKEAARQAAADPDNSDNAMASMFGPAMMMGPAPIAFLVEEFSDVIDFTTLPDFALVKQHFGPSVGHMKGTEQGLYLEFVTLKAPPMAP